MGYCWSISSSGQLGERVSSSSTHEKVIFLSYLLQNQNSRSLERVTGVFYILMQPDHFLFGLEIDLAKMNQFYLPSSYQNTFFWRGGCVCVCCEITLGQRPKQQTKVAVCLVDKSGSLESVIIEYNSELGYRQVSQNLNTFQCSWQLNSLTPRHYISMGDEEQSLFLVVFFI